MPLNAHAPPLQEIGDYEIVAKIAEGGMGTVYKARRKTDGLIVAIKIIPATAAKNAVLLQRFKREFEVARQLDHKNIVKAIEYCGNVATPFLVMEYVEGESLGQKIERDGKLSEAESIKIMADVCQGLHRAHKQNMIHRDVKPDNVLIAPDGVAKLTDLGLVKDVEGELNLTRTGRGLGTPHFMAPEQFRNAKSADIRCDVYSLGATLYMMVTGKMPFDGCGPLDAWMKKSNSEFPAPKELEPSVSDRLDWAIRRAMSADPDLRPASCREFFEDITGASTRQSSTTTAALQDLWYMAYKDDEGAVHTVKGTAENIRKAYRDGLLGDAANIRAGRSKQGPFQPLKTYPEFRDLVIAPEVSIGPAESGGRSRPGGPSTLGGANGESVPDATMPYATNATPGWQPSGPTAAFPTPVAGKFPATPERPPAPQRRVGLAVTITMLLVAAALGSLLAVFLPRIFR
jgi:serine/threonine protein kinase